MALLGIAYPDDLWVVQSYLAPTVSTVFLVVNVGHMETPPWIVWALYTYVVGDTPGAVFFNLSGPSCWRLQK